MARERIGLSEFAGTSSRFPSAATETLTGARTLTVAELDRDQFFSFDPGGSARTLTLPAESEAAGALIFVSNEADAAEVLTIANDAAGTIVTPTQNEAAILWCDGTSWYGLVGSTA